MRRAVLLLLLALATSCGRVQTVLRGSTSVFWSTRPAPAHDGVVDDARLAALWVGHATVVLQLDGRVVVTDPVVSATVGQLSKRIVAPGLSNESFPAIDLVAISHVHFDHLSFASLEALESKIGFLALPPGGLSYLPSFAFDAAEVDTWSTLERNGVRATLVPAQHGGSRYAVDTWSDAKGGWVFEHAGLTVYFAGDTGFDEKIFVAIRDRFPSIDLALLPIAPMEPHDEVGRFHLDPKEAVQAFRIVGAKAMIPIHYDTFVNSLDAYGDAPVVLAKELDRQGVPRERVHVLVQGQRKVLLPR